jgi:hypothetical protein
MDFGGPFFVIAIIMVATAGWLANNWIRAKHGYALEDEWGGKTEPVNKEASTRLLEDNRRLAARVEAAEDRIAVLERIVTDSGYRLGHEIEALREEKGKVQ